MGHLEGEKGNETYVNVPCRGLPGWHDDLVSRLIPSFSTHCGPESGSPCCRHFLAALLSEGRKEGGARGWFRCKNKVRISVDISWILSRKSRESSSQISI